MRKIYIFIVFLALLAALFPLILSPAAALKAPAVQADAMLLAEAGTGQILYESKKDAAVQPGGIAKVMTLLIAVEAVEKGTVHLEENITASPLALETSVTAAGLSIKPGETMSLRDYMYSAFIASSGDACNILAQYIAGSAGTFTDMMNDEAERLSCRGTHFSNADGATDPEQYSTAWDEYLIMAEAISHPLFMNIAGTRSYKTTERPDTPSRVLWNTNLMLYADLGTYHKFCVAGKTNDGEGDQYSFISCAKNGNTTLISVVFGAQSSAEDARAPENTFYTTTKTLLDWGFSNFAWATILDKNNLVTVEKVALAEDDDTVEIFPQETISVLARADLTPDDIRKEIVLYAESEGRTLTAPVKKGDVLGEIIVYADGAVRGRTKLVASGDVGLNKVEFLKARISQTLGNVWVRLVAVLLVLLLAFYVWLFFRDIKKRRRRKRKMEEVRKKLIEERKKSIYR